MKRAYVATAVAVLLALTACGGDDDDPSGPNGNGNGNGNTVQATAANAFSPGSITIQAGESVAWAFGPVDHNVTFGSTPGAPASIAATRNATVSRTFDTAGTFPYTCTLHPGMAGTVVVQ